MIHGRKGKVFISLPPPKKTKTSLTPFLSEVMNTSVVLATSRNTDTRKNVAQGAPIPLSAPKAPRFSAEVEGLARLQPWYLKKWKKETSKDRPYLNRGVAFSQTQFLQNDIFIILNVQVAGNNLELTGWPRWFLIFKQIHKSLTAWGIVKDGFTLAVLIRG